MYTLARLVSTYMSPTLEGVVFGAAVPDDIVGVVAGVGALVFVGNDILVYTEDCVDGAE